jgi:signal transduction histidine kinase/CheY-like chemotaxis protein
MRGLFNPDIRQRLWIALALLAVSTIFVGGIAWYALDRAGTRMERLHSETLTQVARALNLSKQSSDIATSAPFLLNLKSPYLIEREGGVLLTTLEPVLTAWPSVEASAQSPIDTYEVEIAAIVQKMKGAITDLVAAAEKLNVEQDATLALNARLARLEAAYYRLSTDEDRDSAERRIWLALQGMANELVGAGHAQNLPGVGEHQRNFQKMGRDFNASNAMDIQTDAYRTLVEISSGEQGLFQVRRRELSHGLESQNALFRIRYNASAISDLAAKFARNAEDFLSEERHKTAVSIDFAKAVILVAGLASVTIALLAAIFVSGYVTGNIKAISDAMLRLAEGDRSIELRRKPVADDEIGKLHHSFRVFRANALRLDRSNRQLHQKNALFEKMFANISEGIAITSDKGHLTATNPNFSDVLRVDPALLKCKPLIDEVMQHSDFADQAVSAGIRAGFRGFTELQNDAGQTLEVRCSRLPDGGGIWLFSDATERRQMDNRLRQIQHIESLGKVTGEVAHDFGNVLSTITANIHLLETGSKKTARKTLLQRMENAAELGMSLTQRLLAFARKQRLKPEVVELNELVDGLTGLVGIGLKDGVNLTADLADEQLPVRVDPGQLESAILNLCLNASQAIEGQGEIHITVAKSGEETAMIEVADNGCGMDESVLSRSLEPFFTARKDGQGTGLGLSMVYGFIKQTGGDIQIDSTPGKGTRVRLVLPLQAAGKSSQTVPVSGRALVVEDDPAELQIATDLMQDLGYEVVRAASFAKAESALQSNSEFDVVLTDLHLDQGCSGWSIVEYCLEKTDSRIIVASGRLPQTHPYSNRQEPRVTCLEKPLTAEVLAQALATKPTAFAAAGA